MSEVDAGREAALMSAVVELADSLVAGYEVTELMTRLAEHCVTLLGADAAGIMLADQRGGLQVIAASSDKTRLLELFQLQRDSGPCLECFNTKAAVSAPDLEAEPDRWAGFAEEARLDGYRAVHAFPLHLRDQTIGALNLFRVDPGPLAESDQRVAQALADVATIGLLQSQAIHQRTVVVDQLQYALDSRLVIEQAKGITAERNHISTAEAFEAIRVHSRSTNSRLVDVVADIVEGRLDPATLPRRPH